MTKETESRFEEIAETAISSAERVECPGAEFVEGLKIILDLVLHRFEGARGEFGEGP